MRRRTRAPRGVTPHLTLPCNRHELSTIGAITSDGAFFEHAQRGAIRSADVVRFLTHLLNQVTGDVVVVLDNAGIHRAKAVQAFVQGHDRLSLVFLPPYAPELNPIELVWAYVKRNLLGNFCARTLDALRAQLDVAWSWVRFLELPQYLMDSNLRRDQ